MPAGRAAVPAIREDEWRPCRRAGDHDRSHRHLSLVLGCVSQRWVMLCCRLRRSSSAAIPTAHSSEATHAESCQARFSSSDLCCCWCRQSAVQRRRAPLRQAALDRAAHRDRGRPGGAAQRGDARALPRAAAPAAAGQPRAADDGDPAAGWQPIPGLRQGLRQEYARARLNPVGAQSRTHAKLAVSS